MSIMKISSHITGRSVAWSSGKFGARRLPLRRRDLRGGASLSPGQSLPLLALSQALGNLRPDTGARSASAVSAAFRRGTPARLRARAGHGGQGLLQRLRLVAV